MSRAIQSQSVPVVEPNSFTVIGPATVTSSVSGSVWYVSTSGRPSVNRWSCTIQTGHSGPGYVGRTGRGRYGTGFAGSDTYSSACSALGTAFAGGSNASFPPGWKYRDRGAAG